MMTFIELKKLDVAGLEQAANNLRTEIFHLRFNKITGQTKDTSQFKKVRTALAQTLLLLSAKQRVASIKTKA
jgi:ribosomal protein L29